MNPIEQVTSGVTGGAKNVLNIKNIVIIILTALVLYLLTKRFMTEKVVLKQNADGDYVGKIERKLQLRKTDEEDEDDYEGEDYEDENYDC